MDEQIRQALAASRYHRNQCEWCNCPVVQFSGDSDTGITRVDCGECGARFTRFDRSSAIAWLAREFAAAVQLGQEANAMNLYRRLVDLWVTGGLDHAAVDTWIMTRRGSGADADDEESF